MGVKAVNGTRICSGCIRPFSEKDLVTVVKPESKQGPAYNTCMCNECQKKAGLETIKL